MRGWRGFFLLFCLSCLLAGCGKEQKEEKSGGYRIWYMNQEETRLEYERRELLAKSAEGLLKEAMEALREQPGNENLKPALPETVRLENYTMEHDQLYLDFSSEYAHLSRVGEILCRAALVRTLCQIPEVGYVGIRVDGEPLKNFDGKPVGLINEDQFIENAGEEINAYKTADLTLYYTNQAGDKLVRQRVAMEYNSNISLEKLVVERLIEGPPFSGAYPTIPPDTKLVSISIKDGICYVNLNEAFLEPAYNVAESVPIYSLVNSLVRNTDAEKVQISINGETKLTFRESIHFETIFEKNEELIE